jgi:hypothetical protein
MEAFVTRIKAINSNFAISSVNTFLVTFNAAKIGNIKITFKFHGYTNEIHLLDIDKIDEIFIKSKMAKRGVKGRPARSPVL